MPWRRKWQPTPVFLPGEAPGQRSLASTVHGVAKRWMGLSDIHTYTHILLWSFLFSFIDPQPSTILSHLSCFFILTFSKPQKLSASLWMFVSSGCVCEDLGVVMEKHVWLDEHLSGSSVFVFLCVGISVREWIFVWICKLGCDFAFLGGVSWVMRMYNCWYIHLKCLVWRRCFYSPCVESPSDWGFGEVNSVKERLGVRSSFFLISLPHLSFLFLPLSFPSSNRGMCLVEWKAGLWYRGGEAGVMDWEADREALLSPHLATWLLSQRNLERRDVERYLYFKKKNAAWRMELREMVGRLLSKPRRDNGEEGTTLWDEINRT